jgi:DNA-binding NarL/FixJ family response regulator
VANVIGSRAAHGNHVFMARAVPSADGPQPEHDQISVVLVEGHEQLRQLLMELLINAGIDVVAGVGSFDEGHAASLLHRPTVIVLGERLEGGLGVALCTELAQALPTTPIVIHSSVVTGYLIQRARDAGATAVVAKSISGEPLIATITQLGGGMSPSWRTR